MKKFLVKESSNYADEFDIQGFKIIKAKSKEDVENKLIDGREFPCEIYFGTNESQEYETREDLLNDIEIIELNDIQSDVLHKLFGKLDYPFGTTAII